jgi:xanthine phosphoribosyltransferase
MSNFIITPELFKTLSENLLSQLKEKNKEYKAILCPLRGGFYLSYYMSQHLKLPLSYIEISSYAEKKQTSFQIGIKPDLVHGKILLCDDIYDSGNTAKKIHSMYPHVDFDTACLVTKIEDADIFYAKSIKKDVWVDFFWEIM